MSQYDTVNMDHPTDTPMDPELPGPDDTFALQPFAPGANPYYGAIEGFGQERFENNLGEYFRNLVQGDRYQHASQLASVIGNSTGPIQ